MNTLIELSKKNIIDYEKIKNNQSDIFIKPVDNIYDINVIIGAKGRNNFVQPIIDNFNDAIINSSLNICLTLVEINEFPEHLKKCKTNNIDYLWTEGNVNGQWSRSFAYNFGVKYASVAKHYLLHDLDILVKRNFFEELMLNCDENTTCIQPYGKRRVLYLSNDLTNKIIKKEIDINSLNEKSQNVSYPQITGSKGGSLFIDRNTFFEVGGFDADYFWEYGPEDQMFWDKLSVISQIEYADSPPIDVFHMWHEPTYNTNPLIYQMESIWHSFRNMDKEKQLELIKLKKELFTI